MKYYLDQEVRFDTKACYLGRPSNDVVQRMARLASLMADASAPTELSPGQKAKLSRHPEVIRLCQRNKALTARIHAAGYRPIGAAKGTRLYEKKKTAEARLNCFKTRLRTDMMEKARKRHFRKADTIAFDAQFSGAQTSSLDVQPAGPIQYQLPERAAVVRLTCTPSDGLTEQGKLTRRIEAITARAALCRRQETRRRRGPEPPIDPDESDAVWADPDAGEEHQFPVVCKPTQCIFCLGDERKLYQGRIAEYSRPNKMMNEAERHLTGFASESPIPCPHPRCKASGLVRPQAMAFKSHTAKVHKIMLRA